MDVVLFSCGGAVWTMLQTLGIDFKSSGARWRGNLIMASCTCRKIIFTGNHLVLNLTIPALEVMLVFGLYKWQI